MIDYALTNIVRRWPRSLLMAGGVALMMTLVITTTGIVEYQLRAMNRHAAAAGGKIFVQSILAGTEFPPRSIDLDEQEAEGILDREGIQDALSSKAVFWQLRPPLYPTDPPQLLLAGIEPGREEAFTGSVAFDVKPERGTEFFPPSGCEIPVILGAKSAALLSQETGHTLEVGDSLTILATPLQVIGVLQESANLSVNNSLIVPLPAAQSMLGTPGRISSVILTVERLDQTERILQEIHRDYPKLNTVTEDYIRRNAQEGIQVFENMIYVIGTVVLIGAAAMLAGVTTMTVRERTREIGVLRALGASAGAVSRSVILEILILSTCGSLLGAVASGFLLRFAMTSNLFDPIHILKFLPLAVVLTIAAGILPVIQIVRVLPAVSLRYE
jgi:ABC-type lipoprotein release transport system permease subunit